MHLWDHLLPQAENTLNMIQPTNIAPMVSAYAYMYGQYDYNKMPMALMGWAALIHIKPNTRKTWDVNAINGYYLGTLQEHCWCYKVWVKQTRSIQVMDMAYFKHQCITMPTYTKADEIMAAAQNLMKVLTQEANSNIINHDREKIIDLATIFQNVAQKLPQNEAKK